MAEARMATADPLPPLFLHSEIDPSQHKVQIDANSKGLQIFIPHPRYLIRGLLRWCARIRTKVEMAFSPVPLPVVFGLQAGALAVFMRAQSGQGVRNSGFANWLWNLDTKYNPFARFFSNEARVACQTTAVGLTVVSGFAYGQRQFLKFLLSYTDWMLEPRGKTSLSTKVWGFLLKYVYMSRPSSRMLAYQSVLPHLPLPAVADTVRRYLDSMEPILDAEEFATLKKQAETFLATDAFKLQLLLWLKRNFWANNYITDWWVNYVYLRGRGSIFINSNFYGFSIFGKPPSSNQAARAALTTYLFMEQKQILEAERIKPIMINGIVPLCMAQYTPAFSTTREPHPEQDRLVTYESYESRHITVIYKGHYFKLDVYDDNKGVMGKLLSPLQLEAAFKRIIDSVDSVCKRERDRPPEGNLAALTTDNRSTWSAVRTDIIKRDPTSRQGLDLIERSLFVFTLLPDDMIDAEDTTRLANTFFLGDGRSYWCDKSINLVVTRQGHLGLIGEHTWADAPTLAHIYDAMLANEASGNYYAEDGSIKPTPKELEKLANKTLKIYHAERITFHISEPLKVAIHDAWDRAKHAIADVDHVCHRFPSYGKGVIKQAKCSPDAWVQMALQLAYYRNQGKFTQTYESSMARLYVDGRTETVRSASKASCAFVKAMEDPTCDVATRRKLLREACEHHHHTSTLAMTGKGVDRHLFGLYVAAAGLGIKCEFLNSVLGRGWKLSTSQTPAGQAVDEWKATPKHLDTHPRPGGGFGPVADDGFGVSYTFTGDQYVFFHVSSKHSCEATGSQKFFNALHRALNEMALMFDIPDKYFVIPPAQWQPIVDSPSDAHHHHVPLVPGMDEAQTTEEM